MLVQLRSRERDDRVEALVGTRALREHARLWITGDVDVYKPDGQPLLLLRRGAVTEGAKAEAWPFLREMRKYKTENRGHFAAAARICPRRKADGKQSSTNRAYDENGNRVDVPSGIAGYFDRYPRTPYCRQTAATLADPAGWAGCRPMLQEVARVMERCVPKRYAAQLAQAEKTHPAYVVPGTPFTTITVNNTFAGGYHRDAGDYAPGFGAMAVFRRGTYAGCELVLPAFGIGVDLQDRDLVLFDVHEVHGNTPFRDAVGEPVEDHERVSVVFYYREKMAECLSPEEELERAKVLRGSFAPEDEAVP